MHQSGRCKRSWQYNALLKCISHKHTVNTVLLPQDKVQRQAFVSQMNQRVRGRLWDHWWTRGSGRLWDHWWNRGSETGFGITDEPEVQAGFGITDEPEVQAGFGITDETEVQRQAFGSQMNQRVRGRLLDNWWNRGSEAGFWITDEPEGQGQAFG